MPVTGLEFLVFGVPLHQLSEPTDPELGQALEHVPPGELPLLVNVQ